MFLYGEVGFVVVVGALSMQLMSDLSSSASCGGSLEQASSTPVM